jgi:hypothetical protein
MHPPDFVIFRRSLQGLQKVIRYSTQEAKATRTIHHTIMLTFYLGCADDARRKKECLDFTGHKIFAQF